MADSNGSKSKRPLIAGEVLFDRFPDGQEVLGGAPFNVAWNLRGFGENPLFVSAVGEDALGGRVREQMRDWGLDPAGVAVLPDHPTGLVEVKIENDEPSYEIVGDRAYDHIPMPGTLEADALGLVYHGSLGLRHEDSRRTILRLREECGLPRFVDLNIRQPWFRMEWLSALIGEARWLKLNRDELVAITGGAESSQFESFEERVESLREQFAVRDVLITAGGDGATWHADSGVVYHRPAPEPPHFRDTVGAGDAFASVMILGILKEWPPVTSLEKALVFASRVCGLRGATTNDLSFYRDALEPGLTP